MGHSRSRKIQINCSHLLSRYQTFYLDSQIALCVYDITKRESFPVLKGWIDELKAKGPENMRMIIKM